MPKKPTCFGIKVWVIAEVKTGYAGPEEAIL